jgi:hypothetical protein
MSTYVYIRLSKWSQIHSCGKRVMLYMYICHEGWIVEFDFSLSARSQFYESVSAVIYGQKPNLVIFKFVILAFCGFDTLKYKITYCTYVICSQTIINVCFWVQVGPKLDNQVCQKSFWPILIFIISVPGEDFKNLHLVILNLYLITHKILSKNNRQKHLSGNHVRNST